MKSNRSAKSSLSMKKGKISPLKKSASSAPARKMKVVVKVEAKKTNTEKKNPVKKAKVAEKSLARKTKAEVQSPMKKKAEKTKPVPVNVKAPAKKNQEPEEKKRPRAAKSDANDSEGSADEDEESAKKVQGGAIGKGKTRAMKEEGTIPATKRKSRTRKSAGADANTAIVEKEDTPMPLAEGVRRDGSLAREVKQEPVVKKNVKFIKKEGKPTVAKGKARAKKSTDADNSNGVKGEADVGADGTARKAQVTKKGEAGTTYEANTRLMKRDPHARKKPVAADKGAVKDSGAIVETLDEPMPLADEANPVQPSRAQLLAARARVNALSSPPGAGGIVEGQTGEIAMKSSIKMPRHPMDMKPKENEINIVPLKEQLLAEWNRITHVDDAKLSKILDELSTVYLSFNVLVESKVGATLHGLIQRGLIRVPETKEKAQKLIDAWASVTKHSKPRPGARLGIYKTEARIEHEKKVALKKYEQKVSMMSARVEKPVASFESIQSQFAVTENEFTNAQNAEEPTQA